MRAYAWQESSAVPLKLRRNLEIVLVEDKKEFIPTEKYLSRKSNVEHKRVF